jgi:energy-coupling factor transporter ATP-binding protein EcfA2
MNENNNKSEEIASDNAIDFIKSSVFYSDPKYDWLFPLINKVLTDELTDADIDNLLSIDNPESTVQTATRVISKPVINVVEPSNIRSINEITTLSNVGLVNITKPQKLKAGLNIFYGKNGAGKSSIYNALCSILGKKDKKVHPNLEAQGSDTFCLIKYTNQLEEVDELRWDMGRPNPNSPTMIFDGQIAQVLVDYDQDNKFEIAHLKLEYFSYLHNLYERIDKTLQLSLETIQSQIQMVEQSKQDTLGFLFNKSIDELATILATTLSATEESRLKEIEANLDTLSKNNPEAVVKNLTTTKDKIIEILKSFGSKDIASGEYQMKHTREKIDALNDRIRVFNETKKVLEEGGVNKLSKLIPSEWVQNPLWSDFIAKSVEFTESLNDASKHQYVQDNCVYCQQKLATEDSKKLIDAYHEITAEHKTKLEEEKISIEGIANTIENTYITKLGTIADINTSILAELAVPKITTLETIDPTALTAIYTGIKDSITGFKIISVTDAELSTLNNFYATYIELEKTFSTRITELNTAITNRVSTLKTLTNEVIPLRQKSVIKNNSMVLLNYLDAKKKQKELTDKISNISSIKQATSMQETNFAKVASFLEFKACLEEEYKHFNFTPPSFWNIKTVTPGGVNKRSYSLADKRLADIFSEGERKLHALADFFAQCEVNKYKGVYIFDDPVNSLDEDNIIRVAKRIMKLAEDGNQVIVFTHNLYFLNSLSNNVTDDVLNVSKNTSSKEVEIRTVKLDDVGKQLKTKFENITEQMKLLESVSHPSTTQIGAVYDLMSGYIEEYVEKKLLCNVVSRYRVNIRMTSLSSLSTTIFTQKLQVITELYESTSRGGNRHDRPEDAADPTYEQLEVDVKNLTDNLNYR